MHSLPLGRKEFPFARRPGRYDKYLKPKTTTFLQPVPVVRLHAYMTNVQGSACQTNCSPGESVLGGGCTSSMLACAPHLSLQLAKTQRDQHRRTTTGVLWFVPLRKNQQPHPSRHCSTANLFPSNAGLYLPAFLLRLAFVQVPPPTPGQVDERISSLCGPFRFSPASRAPEP